MGADELAAVANQTVGTRRADLAMMINRPLFSDWTVHTTL
jgi:hypothetical protein